MNLKNKHVIIFIFSEALMKLITFTTLPFITEKLSVADFGLYGIFLVNLVIISALFVSILNNYVLVNFFRDGLQKTLLKLKSAIIFCSLAILTGICFAILFIISNTGKDYSLAFIWALLACLTSIPWQIYLSIMQCKKNFLHYSYSVFSYITFYCVLFIIIFHKEHLTWENFSILYALSNLLISISILVKERKITYKLIKAKTYGFKQYTKHFITLLPNSFFSWLRVNFDKYFIAFFMGNTVLGIYSLGFQIGSAIGLLNAVIIKILNPYLFSAFSQQTNKNIKRHISFIILFLCFVVIFYILVIPFIFDIFFEQQYEKSIFIAQIITVGYFLQSLTSIFSAALFYEKHNKLISTLSFTSFLLVFITFIIIKITGSFNLQIIAMVFTLIWGVHLILTCYFTYQTNAFKRLFNAN